jgi:UDP-N-acetylmuramoyl-tripeptide--D-alanyl-D-alanine ligase
LAEGRLAAAATAMGGSLIAGDPERVWRGAALDSRSVRGDELFFALPGERTDGHRFVGDAWARGAAAAVVQREVEAVPETTTRGGLIRVPDTLAALHELTREVRRRLPRHLVAVTGSAGKTTTKELLAGMLARRFRVERSPGNLNNLFGFPIALLGVAEGTEWMVAEMGMSEPGELGEVSRLGRPDVAVYTNVRAVHLEFFDSVRAIGDAKAELLLGLAPDGLVVANSDDPEVARIARSFAGRVVWYGTGSESGGATVDVRAEQVVAARWPEAGSRFVLAVGDERSPVHLPIHGLYNVENFLAAAACAWALGVSVEEIAAAAGGARAVSMRGVLHALPGNGVLIDDCYNSNPAALAGALESARELALAQDGGRRWAVLGSMLELGATSDRLHREAGERAAALGFSPVLGVGEAARELVEGGRGAGSEASWWPDAAAAAGAVKDLLAAGDVILVKGSRGVGLEVVVGALLEAAGELEPLTDRLGRGSLSDGVGGGRA